MPFILKGKKMKIKLDYSKEELSILLDGLNNAIIALQDVYGSAQFGCEVPKKFEKLFEDKSFEEIDKMRKDRISCLKHLYEYLLLYEDS